ncbi:MAG: hypothetical protein WDM77_02470 [Steroidobacteraceae bacterium]
MSERGDAAIAGDDHFYDYRQALLVLNQGSQIGGELLRKHRENASCGVNRGGVLAGVLIDRGASSDYRIHVGDRDQQAGGIAAHRFGD